MVISVTIFSCRSTKSIQTAISKKDSVQLIVADSASIKDSIAFINTITGGLSKNRVDFETFSAKVKVAFQGSDGKRNDFNAFIRIKKDSYLGFRQCRAGYRSVPVIDNARQRKGVEQTR